MTRPDLHPLMERISESIEELTPKARIFGEYIITPMLHKKDGKPIWVLKLYRIETLYEE